MAHYDCSFCGASMGIDFGYCTSCTPKEWFEAEKIVKQIQREREELIAQSPEDAGYILAYHKSDLENTNRQLMRDIEHRVRTRGQ